MELTEYFLENIKELPGIRIAGRPDVRQRVAVVSLDFQAGDNAVVAFELEQRAGIMTRVGLHCAPFGPSDAAYISTGYVRFAFSASNTKEEIDICIQTLRELV